MSHAQQCSDARHHVRHGRSGDSGPSRKTLIILVVCLAAMLCGFVAGQVIGPSHDPASATALATS